MILNDGHHAVHEDQEHKDYVRDMDFLDMEMRPAGGGGMIPCLLVLVVVAAAVYFAFVYPYMRALKAAVGIN